MKKLFTAFYLLFSICAYADNASPFNMGYVEINDNALSIAGCYLRSDTNKPFFDMVSILGANINGADPNQPYIYFNPQVDNLLNRTNQISLLQAKGMKVFMSILGNHQNAGWACMTEAKAIADFADRVVDMVNRYHLDGVDIDDEYSVCMTNQTSLIRIAKAIKQHPRFQGKILSKALFQDRSYFAASYEGDKLADFLDYGWEMSYGYTNRDSRLTPYVKNGVQKSRLALGENTQHGAQIAQKSASYIMEQGYAGMMIYDVTASSGNYLSKLAQTEWNTAVYSEPGCQ